MRVLRRVILPHWGYSSSSGEQCASSWDTSFRMFIRLRHCSVISLYLVGILTCLLKCSMNLNQIKPSEKLCVSDYDIVTQTKNITLLVEGERLECQNSRKLPQVFGNVRHTSYVEGSIRPYWFLWFLVERHRRSFRDWFAPKNQRLPGMVTGRYVGWSGYQGWVTW